MNFLSHPESSLCICVHRNGEHKYGAPHGSRAVAGDLAGRERTIMTLLTKTIRRELAQTFDRRNWIVELESWGVSFRAKRTRKQFGITWDSIWTRAMVQEAERVLQEKKARRKRAA